MREPHYALGYLRTPFTTTELCQIHVDFCSQMLDICTHSPRFQEPGHLYNKYQRELMKLV